MTHSTNPTPSSPARRRAAWAAGLGLLAMALLAPFAHFFVFGTLVVPDDARATVTNLASSAALFRAGIAALLAVVLLDVVVAWALHVVLEPVNRALSLLAAWFRLAYAAAFAVALTPLFDAVQIASDAARAGALEPDLLHVQVMGAIGSFQHGWDLALAIFALHLICLGVVVVQASFLPRFLGGFVMLAGAGYAVDSFGTLLVPTYGVTVSEFTFVGEALLIFWLVALGIRGFETSTRRAVAVRNDGAPAADASCQSRTPSRFQ